MVNFFVDCSFVELWGILLLSTFGANVDEKQANYISNSFNKPKKILVLAILILMIENQEVFLKQNTFNSIFYNFWKADQDFA